MTPTLKTDELIKNINTRAGVDYLIFVSIARATKLGMFNYHCDQSMSFRQIADAIMKSHGKAVVSQLKDLT